MEDPTTGQPFYSQPVKPAVPELTAAEDIDPEFDEPSLAASTLRQAQPSGHPTSSNQPLPDDFQGICDCLKHIVDASTPRRFAGAHPDQLAPSEVRNDAVHSHKDEAKGWIKSFFPSSETVDRLFAYEHMGNFVIERKSGRKEFESMPLYVRVGMHLLFVSASEVMAYRQVEKLLIEQSIKQGKQYDATGAGVLPHIQGFVKAYAIPLNDLLEQDLAKYPTFNSFFARRLLPNARPVACPDDVHVLVCPADCRLSVFETVDNAKALWIKGRQFTIPNLLYGNDKNDKTFEAVTKYPCAIAVARLAPQDYHRFHSPVDGEIVCIKDIPGELYTVNPQAVNEDLNVFTLNKRSVMLIHADLGLGAVIPVAFVAVGAMLVGSILWSKKAGERVKKGEELGWFQFGGSTCIVVVPHTSGLKFDEDLLKVSSQKMETLVSVGMSLGHVGGSPNVQRRRLEG